MSCGSQSDEKIGEELGIPLIKIKWIEYDGCGKIYICPVSCYDAVATFIKVGAKEKLWDSLIKFSVERSYK